MTFKRLFHYLIMFNNYLIFSNICETCSNRLIDFIMEIECANKDDVYYIIYNSRNIFAPNEIKTKLVGAFLKTFLLTE